MAEGYVTLDMELQALREMYEELSITNFGNDAYQLEIDLKPRVEHGEETFINGNLIIKISKNYPNELPKIFFNRTRGLSDDKIKHIYNTVNLFLEQHEKSAMLYDIINCILDCLDSNLPCTPCPICLEEFTNVSNIVKSTCSHYFHGFCLKKYLTNLKENNELDIKTEKKLLSDLICPVCREVLTNIDYILQNDYCQESSIEKEFIFKPDENLIQMQKRFKYLYEKQKRKGGIIDIEANKNKYLVKEGTTVQLNSKKKKSTFKPLITNQVNFQKRSQSLTETGSLERFLDKAKRRMSFPFMLGRGQRIYDILHRYQPPNIINSFEKMCLNATKNDLLTENEYLKLCKTLRSDNTENVTNKISKNENTTKNDTKVRVAKVNKETHYKSNNYFKTANNFRYSRPNHFYNKSTYPTCNNYSMEKDKHSYHDKNYKNNGYQRNSKKDFYRSKRYQNSLNTISQDNLGSDNVVTKIKKKEIDKKNELKEITTYEIYKSKSEFKKTINQKKITTENITEIDNKNHLGEKHVDSNIHFDTPKNCQKKNELKEMPVITKNTNNEIYKAKSDFKKTNKQKKITTEKMNESYETCNKNRFDDKHLNSDIDFDILENCQKRSFCTKTSHISSNVKNDRNNEIKKNNFNDLDKTGKINKSDTESLYSRTVDSGKSVPKTNYNDILVDSSLYQSFQKSAKPKKGNFKKNNSNKSKKKPNRPIYNATSDSRKVNEKVISIKEVP